MVPGSELVYSYAYNGRRTNLASGSPTQLVLGEGGISGALKGFGMRGVGVVYTHTIPFSKCPKLV